MPSGRLSVRARVYIYIYIYIYISRVKWSNPGNGVAPLPLHIGVVAI